jgi:DNA-binding FrmR family transcriptional regulator
MRMRVDFRNSSAGCETLDQETVPAQQLDPRGASRGIVVDDSDDGLDRHRRSPHIYPTPHPTRLSAVSHTIEEKAKLIGRVRRIRGQIEALERAIADEKGCAAILHLVAAARGAINGLMAEVIEDHIRLHVAQPTKDAERSRGAKELIDAVQSYLK